MASIADLLVAPAAHQVPEGWRGQAAVFDEIFLVFMILGTLVGTIVIAYMLWNGYKYRRGASAGDEFEGPELGELPVGGPGGKKLFLSFAISAIIVISLVAWTYMALLYVEAGATEQVDPDMEVNITGLQFGWQFEYPNGHQSFGTLRLPADRVVGLTATSRDVWHTFGITELRVKLDAIPGQTSESWVHVEEPNEYQAECFELCGVGHSQMTADVIVMPEDQFDEWYEGTQDDE